MVVHTLQDDNAFTSTLINRNSTSSLLSAEDKEKLMVVALIDQTCVQSKNMLRSLDYFSKYDFKDTVLFFQIDPVQIPNLESRYEIHSVPTVLLFKGGQHVGGAIEAKPLILGQKLKERM